MTYTPPDVESFTRLVVEATDPRTESEVVVNLISRLDRDVLESLVLAVAATLGSYYEDHATRLGVDLDTYMKQVERHCRDSVTLANAAVDELIHEGGLFT